MDLLVENGILLKPYTLAWAPKGWGHKPKGWTPGNNEWITQRIEELQRETPGMHETIARIKAEQEYGQRLHAKRQPWSGWVPVNARSDLRISRAYRQFFIDMNPDIDGGNVMSKTAQEHAEWPPDGRYRYRKGELELVEMRVSLGRSSPFVAITELAGIKAEDVQVRIRELADIRQEGPRAVDGQALVGQSGDVE